MTVALVCDWLTETGGAEKVLLELHHMYPDAPIYTSQYRSKKIDWFNDATVKTGWLNLFPACFRKILGPLRQFYFSHLDLSHYDLVISVTGAEAKAVRTTPRPYLTQTQPGKYEVLLPPQPHTTHICYCHVPTQYYWQMYDQYLENPGFGFLNPIIRLALKLLVNPLRKRDYASAQRPDQFVTISRYAADLIKEHYHREAEIIYPPVDTAAFTPSTSVTPSDKLIISCRQVTWKRVDLAIEACRRLHLPLQVVGDGPEHKKLVALASTSSTHDKGDNIEFIPWQSAADLSQLLQSSRAYLFPSLEPFGIAAVEALSAGCPVIAYDAGGSLDIVHSGENGLFFSHQSVDSLVSALQELENTKFDRAKISASAAQFDLTHFCSQISDLIHKLTSIKSSHPAQDGHPAEGKHAKS